MKKRVLATALIGLALAVIAACGGSGSDGPAPTAEPTRAAATPTAEATAAATPSASTDGNVVKVVNQDPGGSGEYKFVPSELEFSVGDTVTFQVSAETEFHTFEVDELGISQEMEAGQTIEFKVTFDKAGTFELYCVPHEALGMTGTITVN